MENKKIKLVYIIDSLRGGGVNVCLRERLNFLANHTNFELIVISEITNNKIMVSEFDKKVKFYNLALETVKPKTKIPVIGYFMLNHEIKKKYNQLFKEIQPDIITVFNLEAHYKDIVPFIKTKAKKVLEFHGSYLGSTQASKYKKTKTKKRLRPTDWFKTPSKKLHNLYDYATILTKEDSKDRDYLKIPKIQIFNSVNLNQQVIPFKERENKIIGIGRLSDDKNFDDLIKAINLIKDEFNGWRVEIYGNGNMKSSLLQLIDDLRLENIVSLKGHSFNISEIYNSSKILVSTSLTEGMPLNLLEAKGFKIPIIAYNCKCGPKEIISNGVNGYLIDFNIQHLADKILELTSNQEKLESFSSHTWDDIQKFDENIIMNQWIEFYTVIVNKQ